MATLILPTQSVVCGPEALASPCEESRIPGPTLYWPNQNLCFKESPWGLTHECSRIFWNTLLFAMQIAELVFKTRKRDAWVA